MYASGDERPNGTRYTYVHYFQTTNGYLIVLSICSLITLKTF